MSEVLLQSIPARHYSCMGPSRGCRGWPMMKKSVPGGCEENDGEDGDAGPPPYARSERIPSRRRRTLAREHPRSSSSTFQSTSAQVFFNHADGRDLSIILHVSAPSICKSDNRRRTMLASLQMILSLFNGPGYYLKHRKLFVTEVNGSARRGRRGRGGLGDSWYLAWFLASLAACFASMVWPIHCADAVVPVLDVLKYVHPECMEG